jgi:DNA-binding phage protein
VDEFIDKLVEKAERDGLSLSEVARRAGCGRSYLHRVIHGEQSPSFVWVQKVAKAVGLKLKLVKK